MSLPKEIENPMVRPIIEYRKPIRGQHGDACDVCDEYAWEVKFLGTCLCSDCAREAGIELR